MLGWCASTSSSFRNFITGIPTFSDTIFASIAARMQAVKDYVKAMPSTRIHLYGEYQDVCAETVRSFLRANRLQFEWHATASTPAMEIDGIPLAQLYNDLWARVSVYSSHV